MCSWNGLVQASSLDLIAAVLRPGEHFFDLGMAHGVAGGIGQQILLRDISHIFRLGVFSKKMIKRLILARPDFFGNGEPPFFCIREYRVDIVNDPAERIFTVADDLADSEFRVSWLHRHGEGPGDEDLSR